MCHEETSQDCRDNGREVCKDETEDVCATEFQEVGGGCFVSESLFGLDLASGFVILLLVLHVWPVIARSVLNWTSNIGAY